MFKFFDYRCYLYMRGIFDKSCISQTSTRNSIMKLSQPLRRTSYGQNCISFFAPSVWKSLPNELKSCTNLNIKHKILNIKLRNTSCIFSLILFYLICHFKKICQFLSYRGMMWPWSFPKCLLGKSSWLMVSFLLLWWRQRNQFLVFKL